MFAVDPKAQSQGIGRALFDAAERIATDDWQLDRMQMTVIAQRDDLIAWYEAIGYVRTGRPSRFPGADQSDPADRRYSHGRAGEAVISCPVR